VTCELPIKNRHKEDMPYYERNKKIIERKIDNVSFLVNPVTEEIFYLNSLSSAIWQLLQQPISIEEIVDIVIKAFPNILPERIFKDTSMLFEEFVKKDIVMLCD